MGSSKQVDQPSPLANVFRRLRNLFVLFSCRISIVVQVKVFQEICCLIFRDELFHFFSNTVKNKCKEVVRQVPNSFGSNNFAPM